MSTFAAGTKSLLPTLLLVAVVSVLVLVVLPAVLAAAGGTAI
jgi:competence protein ComGC